LTFLFKSLTSVYCLSRKVSPQASSLLGSDYQELNVIRQSSQSAASSAEIPFVFILSSFLVLQNLVSKVGGGPGVLRLRSIQHSGGSSFFSDLHYYQDRVLSVSCPSHLVHLCFSFLKAFVPISWERDFFQYTTRYDHFPCNTIGRPVRPSFSLTRPTNSLWLRMCLVI
jgi:hypothetical protein